MTLDKLIELLQKARADIPAHIPTRIYIEDQEICVRDDRLVPRANDPFLIVINTDEP